MNGFSARIGWAAVFIAGLVSAQSALGFYFQGWPSGPKPPASLLLASPPPTQGQSPPKGTTDHGGGPSGGGDPGNGSGDPEGGSPGNGDPPPSHAAPEPGTAALAMIGLGAAALLRRGRRAGSQRA